MKRPIRNLGRSLKFLQVSSVQTRVPVIRSRRPTEREKGYTPQSNLLFLLHEHGEDTRRWDGKPTSVLAALVHKLKEEVTNEEFCKSECSSSFP